MSLQSISPNLTEDHLHAIIRQRGGVKYTSWQFDDAAGFKKGDGYLSELYKLIVKGVDNKNAEIVVNIVIKTTPKSIARCKTFRSSEFFGNEINFFTKIFKEFDDFQQVKKDAKYPFNELPSCLASHFDGKNDFIVLENLEPFGYFTASRQKSMDIHVTRLVMRTLGRFHGLSFLVRDQSPKTFEEISVVPFETYYAARLKPWYHDFINHQISIALDAVKKIYFETEIEERAKKFLSDGSLYDKMVEMTHTRNRYSVIGHGDCWTPNFMINSTKVDGKDIPVKAKMIDYQLCRYASPVLDISFFIYSCTTQDIRDKYFDDLIKTYHDALTEIIRDFGSNPEFLFPMSALKSEMKRFFRFGVGMAIESIPFSVMDDDETSDLSLIEGDEAVPIMDVWHLKKLTKLEDLQRLADVFKDASDRGFLD